MHFSFRAQDDSTDGDGDGGGDVFETRRFCVRVRTTVCVQTYGVVLDCVFFSVTHLLNVSLCGLVGLVMPFHQICPDNNESRHPNDAKPVAVNWCQLQT